MDEAGEWAKEKISEKWGQFQDQIPDDLIKKKNLWASNQTDGFNLLMSGVNWLYGGQLWLELDVGRSTNQVSS